jgi:hypothetical protein
MFRGGVFDGGWLWSPHRRNAGGVLGQADNPERRCVRDYRDNYISGHPADRLARQPEDHGVGRLRAADLPIAVDNEQFML